MLYKTNLKQEAGTIINRPAIDFDTDRRYNNQNAWPFFYSFVPKPYLNTDQLNDGLGLHGITVPAGRVVDIPIRLERDTVYRQINVRYSPFTVTLGPDTGETGTTAVGSKEISSSDGAAYDVGQDIAWIDDSGEIKNGVIRRISGNTLILENKVDSVATAVKIYNRAFRWFETPATPYSGESMTLTGTISIAANQSPAYGEGFDVVGVGTAFDTELEVGDVITAENSEGAIATYTVQAITNATNMRIADRLAEDVEVFAGTSYSLSGRHLESTGTISIAAGGNAVVGVGTLFTTEYSVGDIFKTVNTDGSERYFVVATITDNLNMTVTETLSAIESVSGAEFSKIGTGLTGTAAASSTNKTITGTGTAFTTEVSEGDLIPVLITGGAVKFVVVEKIISDTLLLVDRFYSDALGVAGVYGVLVSDSSTLRSLLIATPLTQYLEVSYIMNSQRGRYLYGGTQVFTAPDSDDSGMQERPLKVKSLQGFRDGIGQLRTPTLQPYEAICTIRIHNTYSSDIIVAGSLYGYKVSLGR